MGSYELYKGKPPPKKIEKLLVNIALGGLLLAIILPFIVEHYTNNLLINKGYELCDVPSSSWPMYKDVYYTVDKQTCIDYNEEQKKKWPSNYPKEDDEPIFKHY